MNTLRIATSTGPLTVPLVDHFTLLLEGQKITLAVHPGIGFMPTLMVSEFTTGRSIARLDVRAISDYHRQLALDAIVKQRERMGAQTMVIRMLEAIGACARLNQTAANAKSPPLPRTADGLPTISVDGLQIGNSDIACEHAGFYPQEDS